jgi:quercetin dioxygenase-like cupin family protein
MPVLINASTYPEAASVSGGMTRTLLDRSVTGNDCVTLKRQQLDAAAACELATAPGELGWLMVIAGAGDVGGHAVGANHIVFFGPDTKARITSVERLDLLWATVPDALRFDPDVAKLRSGLTLIDWSREPVLQSEHDARTRVYMATPKLIGTTAVKAEMITYPPDAAAPEHHHVGAEHFQFVLSGRGTAVLDGAVHELVAGDVLYNYENEPHYFFTSPEAGEEFVFVEFFVPGCCDTIWAPGANVCAWLPTGRDIRGETPVREIGHHVHGDDRGL